MRGPVDDSVCREQDSRYILCLTGFCDELENQDEPRIAGAYLYHSSSRDIAYSIC
mgnify:FL=1